LLVSAWAEELRLGNDGDSRTGQRQSLQSGGDRQSEFRIAVREVIPTGQWDDAVAVAAQHLLQNFAPAGRVRSNQHAPREFVQEQVERGERVLSPRIASQLAGCARRKVGDVLSTLQRGGGLEGVERDRGELRQPGFDIVRADEELGRGKYGPLNVVAAIFVSRFDVVPGLAQRTGQGGVVDQNGIRGKIVEQRGCLV